MMEPVAQSRPRLGKYGVYNPAAAQLKKARLLALSAWNGREQLTGPISVTATFHMPIAASISDRMRFDGTWHSRRPDIDNLEKFLFDALSGICFRDDAQIAQTTRMRKLYSLTPRIEVEITQLECYELPRNC